MAVLKKAEAQGVETFRATLRAAVLKDPYLLAFILGYDTEDHRWSPVHVWALRTKIPQLRAKKGAQVLWLQTRGTYKTAILSEIGLTWAVLSEPTQTHGIGSWKLNVSRNILRQVRRNLNHPVLYWLFPDILYPDNDAMADRWNEDAIAVKGNNGKDATLVAFSVESPPVSLHFSGICMLDDVVERRNTRTAYSIQQVKTTMTDVRNWRGGPRSQIWACGTIWDEEDWHVSLINNPDWTVIRLPAEAIAPNLDSGPRPPKTPFNLRPGDLYFPTVKSREELEADRRSMVGYHFDTQIQVMVAAKGSHTWGRELVQNYWRDLPFPFDAFGFVDLATDKRSKLTKENMDAMDETAAGIWLAERTTLYRLFLVDGIAGQISPTFLVRKLYDWQEEWNCLWFIEEVSGFQYFDNIIQAEAQSRGYMLRHRVLTGKDRHGEAKNDRIWGADPFLRAKRLLTKDPATCDSDEQRDFFQSYEHQLLRHPRSNQRDILDLVADAAKFAIPQAAAPRSLADTTRRDIALARTAEEESEGHMIDRDLGI
jgi:hypothetical protein